MKNIFLFLTTFFLCFIIYKNFKTKNFIETFGNRQSRQKLNRTLKFIVQLLHKNNINDWFVCYGTLLGLIRENNCIDGDDDIDIIVEKKNYKKIKNLLLTHNLEIENYDNGILKTKETNEYASIDIYMADYNEDNVFDIWNKLTIQNCYLNKNKKNFIEIKWKGEKVYIPNNYKKILVNTYGKDWMIKKNEKVPMTTNTI
uniref:LicD/FKTN/FKRP nucleotidyltransferase domain-containing protein n=1 Tax=viral metagenome TaxID=1070528 RepID=A0A6C0BZH7_9ZZZZ